MSGHHLVWLKIFCIENYVFCTAPKKATVALTHAGTRSHRGQSRYLRLFWHWRPHRNGGCHQTLKLFVVHMVSQVIVSFASSSFVCSTHSYRWEYQRKSIKADAGVWWSSSKRIYRCPQHPVRLHTNGDQSTIVILYNTSTLYVVDCNVVRVPLVWLMLLLPNSKEEHELIEKKKVLYIMLTLLDEAEIYQRALYKVFYNSIYCSKYFLLLEQEMIGNQRKKASWRRKPEWLDDLMMTPR